ncbi:receptor-like protein EIX2 [Corylus avellana]|uniref:receptor-like protein EIX2 n=1 Tax=Corylus avellana TaxID=13451 RepID=UPI00286CDE7F|nr:receptor-like protein EIX2 [Corylus avellana]
MVAIVDLKLFFNNFEGIMPQALENLHKLQVLDLSYNNISGEVIDHTKFSLFRELCLSNNQLNGSLTKSLAELSMLQVLDVSSNCLQSDHIIESHLSNLSNLYELDFSYNSVSLKFRPDWVPPFHLDTISLRSCKLGPAFPRWLQTQNLMWLDISDAGISDTIPNWFWDFYVGFLNLSRNNIIGTIPPQWAMLNLSNNMLQGSITYICEKNGSMSDFISLYLSLDLSYNLLSGELPNCWANMPNLFMLNLANSRLSERIPDSIGSLYSLHALHLQNNDFIRELPKSLMKYSLLKLLDVGENRLSGRIPAWIGTSLPHLVVLQLPSNLFNGSIPLQLCELTSLQILDLAMKLVQCLAATIQKQSSNVSIAHDDYSGTIFIQFYMNYYIDNLLVIFKEKYSKTLALVKLIDLSSNKLKGEIPREITSLSGLLGLNLSGNFLTGIIPQNIGDMKLLESLDLSRNHLSGVIPQSLTTLSFLSYLNLSNNNLSGRIPSSTQLQSFNASAYADNQDLCGLPLLRRCLGDEAVQGLQPGRHAKFYEHMGLYTSIALGFIVGFWGVYGLLLLKSSWRHAYFQYLDRIGDKFYVTIAINVAKFMRNFKTSRYQENI